MIGSDMMLIALPSAQICGNVLLGAVA